MTLPSQRRWYFKSPSGIEQLFFNTVYYCAVATMRTRVRRNGRITLIYRYFYHILYSVLFCTFPNLCQRTLAMTLVTSLGTGAMNRNH